MMAVPKSSLQKRGRFYYLHYFDNGVKRRVSLRTGSRELAKEYQR